MHLIFTGDLLVAFSTRDSCWFVWLYMVVTFSFTEFQELVLDFDVMFNVLS